MTRRTRRTGRPVAILRVVGGLVLLCGALALVVWRQTRGVRLEQELSAIEERRAIVEAERVELVREIQMLRSRARVTQVAAKRLDMRLPEDHEIVYLAVPGDEKSEIQLASDG